MRKPVIAGNWKMFELAGESVETALQPKPLVSNANHCEVIIALAYTTMAAPPSVYATISGGVRHRTREVYDQIFE